MMKKLKKMKTGLSYCAHMLFFTWLFYGNTGGPISFDGKSLSQAEFNALLEPKLYFAAFWLIGIGILVYELMKAKKEQE